MLVYHMTFEAKSSEKEKAYTRLLDNILRGEISANSQLSERGLSDHLGLGRTPVREAIKELVREGVLESHPTRGTFLPQLSLTDIQEIYQVRYAIEGLAAFLAAERGPSEALKGYKAAFEKVLNNPNFSDASAVYDEGAEFHIEMFKTAGNANLLKIYEPIRLRFRIALGMPRHHDPVRVFESVREHLQILEAIVNSEGELAQKLICEHLHKGLQVRTRLFQATTGYTPNSITSFTERQ